MEVVELVIKVPANTVTKKVTDYLNVDIAYSYRGPAQRIFFTAVVTQSTDWGEFDEIGSTRKAVYVDVPEGYQSYQTRVPNLPLSGVGPKTTLYGVKIKAEGTFGTIETGNKACLYVEEEAPPPLGFTLSVSVATPAVGYVTKSPSKTEYTAGETVTLRAYLDSWAIGSYVFDHWGGDAFGTSSTTTVTMNRDKNVTAYFKEIAAPPPTYTLTTRASPLAAGWVTKDPNKTSYAYNERVEITAHKAPGYVFSYWVINGIDYDVGPVVNIIMDEDHNVTAYFMEPLY